MCFVGTKGNGGVVLMVMVRNSPHPALSGSPSRSFSELEFSFGHVSVVFRKPQL